MIDKLLHILSHPWAQYNCTVRLLLDLFAECSMAQRIAALRRIAAAGEAGAASALACNTVCALLTFWLLWWALGPPQGVGQAMAVRRLCQVWTGQTSHAKQMNS